MRNGALKYSKRTCLEGLREIMQLPCQDYQDFNPESPELSTNAKSPAAVFGKRKPTRYISQICRVK